AAGAHANQDVVGAGGGGRHLNQFQIHVFLEQQGVHADRIARISPQPSQVGVDAPASYLPALSPCRNVQNSRLSLYGRNESSSVGIGIDSPGFTLAFRSKACCKCSLALESFFSPASAHARL